MMIFYKIIHPELFLIKKNNRNRNRNTPRFRGQCNFDAFVIINLLMQFRFTLMVRLIRIILLLFCTY